MRHELFQSAENSNVSELRFYVATGSLIWFVIVWSVCAIGFTQLYATLSTSYHRKQTLTQTDSATTGGDHSRQHVSHI